MSSNVNLRYILLHNNKLTCSNFLDLFRNLKIILRAEKIAYVLNRPLHQSLPADASDSDQSAYQKHKADSEIASCIMLASMSIELQIQHKTMEAYDIVIHIREIFDKHVRSERFEISKLLLAPRCKWGHL